MNSLVDDLRAAAALVEQQHYEDAERILKPLIAGAVADAFYLYSSFGMPGETDEQFESRRLALLNKAANLNHGEALYLLGVQHDCGDGVLLSSEIASIYFRRAAEAGHLRAKLSYGLDLFYGRNGVETNRDMGIGYVHAAAAGGVDGAMDVLGQLGAGDACPKA